MQGVPITHGHNPLFLPLGKTERAWLDQHSETEASLHQEMYLVTEAPERFIHEASKTPCVHLRFADSPGRFRLGGSDADRSVTVDMSAVRKEAYQILTQENEHITIGFHDRQEEIPIPLVKFIMDLSLAQTLLTGAKIAILHSAVTGKLGMWVEETVKWIKNHGAPALMMYRHHKTEEAKAKSDEWIMFQFDCRTANGPLIELVIPSEHDSDIPEIAIEKFAEQVSVFSDLLSNCDKVVFAYLPDREQCELRYALTRKGGVIGTESCYEESVVPHEKWLASRAAKATIWWTLVTVDDGELAIALYSLNGDSPKSIGYLSIDPEVVPVLEEAFVADDGRLYPMNLQKKSEAE